MEIKIKEIRESKGLSTYEMAKRMKITQSSYARFERGDTKNDIERIYSFSEAVGMSLIDVLVYPEHYINVKDIAKEMKMYEPDVTVQVRVNNEKKEKILKMIFNDSDLDLLTK